MTAVAAISVDLSLPAIPFMVDALGTTMAGGQQIVGIFMAGMAAGQIPAGLLSDRMGRLPVLYMFLAVFLAAAILTAAASDIRLILLARFVQGFGAAAAIVVSRAIVRDIAHGQEAARLMSLMTMLFTFAPVIAPSIGALLITQWDWRAPFIAIALFAAGILFLIRIYLHETHTPNRDGHPLRQLKQSFAEFFSHRQSVFGLLLLVSLPAGFMSIIAVSAALTVEVYGYGVQQYGLIFALAGISILLGAMFNRWLVTRLDQLASIGFGVLLMAISGTQLLTIAWLDAAPFWWLWSSVCLYMFTVAILMANATVLALDPLPRIAGVASSILGTMQNVSGAAGALFAAMIYDGSIRNSVIVIGLVTAAVAVIFLSRPILCPKIVHRGDQLARD
jgi:DHA1 family bicyclomycin/chloramphenicol resistance-like MFS transporter